MAETITNPPLIPNLPPAPQRSQMPTDYADTADVWAAAWPAQNNAINQMAGWIVEAGVYIKNAKMDVASMEGIRDETYAARDATQVIRDDTDQVRLDAITQLGSLADDKIVVMDGIRDDANQAATAAAAYAEAAGQAAGLPEFLEGTEGKPLTRMRDGSGVHFSQEFTPFITVTSTTQLVAGERYRVDTSTGVFNLLLPASPFMGATVFLFDAKGTWRKNTPILKRNGRSIMGLAEDMELNVDNASTGFVFDGTDWRVLA